eukprot:4938541-Alexandrium_andersonii.AAC.1
MNGRSGGVGPLEIPRASALEKPRRWVLASDWRRTRRAVGQYSFPAGPIGCRSETSGAPRAN